MHRTRSRNGWSSVTSSFASTGPRIVGTIGLGGDKLRSLFVEPGLQGKGVGARLVAHLEAHARKAGVAELHLSSSITARGFYERLGYRLIRFDEREVETGRWSGYLGTGTERPGNRQAYLLLLPRHFSTLPGVGWTCWDVPGRVLVPEVGVEPTRF